MPRAIPKNAMLVKNSISIFSGLNYFPTVPK
jgi:hypothetical protein